MRICRLPLLAALVLVLLLGLPVSGASAAKTKGPAAPPPDWLTPQIRDRIAAAGTEGVRMSKIREWIQADRDEPDPSDFLPCVNGDARKEPSVKAGACQVYPHGCTDNFVFRKGDDTPFPEFADGRTFLGTAGHCVDHANQPVIAEITDTPPTLAKIGEVEKKLEGGIGGDGQGNGGLGNDFAIIQIDNGFKVEPGMPPQIGGGPNGIYTGCALQGAKYWGHGFGVVVGPGKDNAGVATTFYDRSFGFNPATGVAFPGDSGSGVMTQSNQSIGDLTHIIIGVDPRFFPSTTVGTRTTRALTWMGGDYFQVNADRTYSRATMADTRCGNSSNSG